MKKTRNTLKNKEIIKKKTMKQVYRTENMKTGKAKRTENRKRKCEQRSGTIRKKEQGIQFCFGYTSVTFWNFVKTSK